MELDANHKPVSVDCDPATPPLWVLCNYLNLTGTRFGRSVAVCGACIVHTDGAAMRLCVLPVAAVVGKHITTIEGLAGGEGKRHALQQAWIDEQVPQCGYCQLGMLMAATNLLTQRPDPTDVDIDAAMINICRCGTYPRMRAVIKRVARAPREGCA